MSSRYIKILRLGVDQCGLYEKDLTHFFRDKPGHLAVDTPANRKLITDLASDPKNYFTQVDIKGNIWCAKTLDDGTQLWAIIREGKIRNGGLNLTPKTWNPKTGLCQIKKPGYKEIR